MVGILGYSSGRRGTRVTHAFFVQNRHPLRVGLGGPSRAVVSDIGSIFENPSPLSRLCATAHSTYKRLIF